MKTKTSNKFSKILSVPIYLPNCKECIVSLEVDVSENISDQMNDKVVNIIHYLWISGNINYLGVFAYYGLEKGNNLSEVETNCLSISPLHFFQIIMMTMMRQRGR